VAERLPPQIQNQLALLQQAQQRLDMLTARKLELERELRETEFAISELEKVNEDAVVYKIVGGLLVQTDRNKLLEELKERKDSLETRLKLLQRQEERARQQVNELREKLKQSLSERGYQVS